MPELKVNLKHDSVGSEGARKPAEPVSRFKQEPVVVEVRVDMLPPK